MVAGWLFVVAACSASTAPDPTLSPETTAPATTTTVAIPTTTATTAAPTTTTTQSPNERLAEIEALAKDVAVGRLRAIYAGDKADLLRWLGSQAGYDDAVRAIDEQRIAFVQEPTHDNIELAVEELLLDRPDCVVVDVRLSAVGVVEGATTPSSLIYIYWPTVSGTLVQGAVWQDGTPQVQWIEECGLARRGVTP